MTQLLRLVHKIVLLLKCAVHNTQSWKDDGSDEASAESDSQPDARGSEKSGQQHDDALSLS
jgi:hypothetical protein